MSYFVVCLSGLLMPVFALFERLPSLRRLEFSSNHLLLGIGIALAAGVI